MMTMRCLVVSLFVLGLLVQTVENKDRSETWQKYKEAYKLDKFNSKFLNYYRLDDVSFGLAGNFSVYGQVRELPAAAAMDILYTKESIPYWYKQRYMIQIIYYFAGSPMKLSNLHENGSITVQYLGDKLDPLCTNLNCQSTIPLGHGAIQKKEILVPDGWSMIHIAKAPFSEGVNIEGAGLFLPETNLQCTLQE